MRPLLFLDPHPSGVEPYLGEEFLEEEREHFPMLARWRDPDPNEDE
jgi:hypothetical protein